jgi:transposase
METSLDLRRRVVAAYRGRLTATYEATAEMFGIGRATVSRILRLERETGDVLRRPRGGNNPRVVELKWLEAHAAAEPDARLVDRVEAWIATGGRRVCLQAMSCAMCAIGWTHKKKTPVARERDTEAVQARRRAFIGRQASLDTARLVFVDESGFRLGSSPRFGWAPRGVDAPGKAAHRAWQTITMLGALALDGFRGFMTIDAGTSGDVFLAFVQQ